MSSIVEKLESYKKFHRLANYLSAAMLYLKDDFFLERDLQQSDIKERVLGHWGTVPGINFIYAGLNIIAQKYNKEFSLVCGPGHGAPAIITNLLLEGTLGKYYYEYTLSKEGIEKTLHDFSWPGKLQSHTSPHLPGAILEGGELGYSLGIAVGSVLDNTSLTSVCIIGDGEAETATLSASWQFNKFLNPVSDGTVLPILHLNGYKISGPTVFSTMSTLEISKYFEGLGFFPIFVDQYTSVDVYLDYLESLITSVERIRKIKSEWETYKIEKPLWPIIILKTKKGWSGPKQFNDEKIEDNNLSHGIPLKNPAVDIEEFNELKKWLISYKPWELLTKSFVPEKEILGIIPAETFTVGEVSQKYANEYTSLSLPPLKDYELNILKKGSRAENRMMNLSEYLRDVLKLSNHNFRIFSPDESESNTLDAMFTATGREYIWPLRSWDKYFSKDGKFMELLSENVLMSWLNGYIASGRHGILISYEAFLNIISSQIDQYIKFLTQALKVSWRTPFPSLNLIATSTLWRQEHNGFTHQNPTLINSLLTKYNKNVNIYFPCDVNTLLATVHKVLESRNGVNLIVACKRDLAQWNTYAEAIELVEKGIGVWDFASQNPINPDVVLCALGDYQTNETLEASKLLKGIVPELNFRFINVNQISQYKFGNEHNLLENDEILNEYFTQNREVIINFHGYPTAIQQLFFGNIDSNRIKILGYIERGGTTTPLDLEIQNMASRFHVCIEAVKSAAKFNKKVMERENSLVAFFEEKIENSSEYIKTRGNDIV